MIAVTKPQTSQASIVPTKHTEMTPSAVCGLLQRWATTNRQRMRHLGVTKLPSDSSPLDVNTKTGRVISWTGLMIQSQLKRMLKICELAIGYIQQSFIRQDTSRSFPPN